MTAGARRSRKYRLGWRWRRGRRHGGWLMNRAWHRHRANAHRTLRTASLGRADARPLGTLCTTRGFVGFVHIMAHVQDLGAGLEGGGSGRRRHGPRRGHRRSSRTCCEPGPTLEVPPTERLARARPADESNLQRAATRRHYVAPRQYVRRHQNRHISIPAPPGPRRRRPRTPATSSSDTKVCLRDPVPTIVIGCPITAGWPIAERPTTP